MQQAGFNFTNIDSKPAKAKNIGLKMDQELIKWDLA